MADVNQVPREPTHTTTIIEKRSSGGTALIAIVLLLAVIVGSWYLYTTAGATNAKNNAVAGAARSVSTAANKVGDAADSAQGK
jgi:hypothetical protein